MVIQLDLVSNKPNIAVEKKTSLIGTSRVHHLSMGHLYIYIYL